MRARDIEILLSRVPPHPSPRAELEQYATPADLAVPLLLEARALGDIEGRDVVDLGCGTGILALGAAMLGASKVRGIDVDGKAVEVARGEAKRLGVGVDWLVEDVAGWRGRCDTILMNPPFGAQVRGADRPFLEAALASAPVVYTFANAPSRAFTEALAAERGFAATHAWAMRFPLRHQYRHQSKAVQDVDVVVLRLSKDNAFRD